jgi:deoxyribonuclease V
MRSRHPWNVTPARAVEIQNRLRGRVERRPRLGALRRVAGIDISVKDGRARAAVVVLTFPDLETAEASVVERPCRFPYVPGLLAFREAPSILAAFRRLRTRPDFLLFDGQGIAHPRRFGIAAHLGVLLDLPSIGCAKSRLIGAHAEPGAAAGSWAPLVDGGETIGAALRTREGVKPVYVSIGHRVDLETAVDLVMRCTRGYRLPEPTRRAHRAAGDATKDTEGVGEVATKGTKDADWACRPAIRGSGEKD